MRQFPVPQNQIEAMAWMRSLILILAVLWTSQSWAAGAVVKDGGTLQLGGVTYRLDGIDAPELDQMCIDEHADTWACGVEARDQLTKLIGGRAVRCEDLGLAPYKSRHIGICTVEGETATPEPAPCPPGLCAEFRTLRQRPLQGRRGRRQGQAPGTLERLLCIALRIPPRPQGRRLAGRFLQEPTRTAKYARCCFPSIP